MYPCISLDYFGAEERKYHVYQPENSAVSEKMHDHDYYQLCYVAYGEVLHEQEAHSVKLRQGDAFLIPPGFHHRIAYSHGQASFYSLSFHPTLFHPGFPQSNVYRFLTAISLGSVENKKLTVRLRVPLELPQQHSVQALMECLLREEASSAACELSAAPSLITAMLCILSQAYLRSADNHVHYQKADYYNQSMTECLRYIDQNITRNLSAIELARQFAMSKSTFYQLFLQRTGVPLKTYLNRKRIEDVKRRIAADPSLPLQEAAFLAGFEIFSTFYRNFVKETGISPREYRRMMR